MSTKIIFGGILPRVILVSFILALNLNAKNTETARWDTGSPLDAGLSSSATLEEYLAYAAMNNAGLQAAFDRWKASLESVFQSGVLPDPRFNYGYFIQNVETRVGAQKQRVGLSQTFPWLGKLKLKKEAAMAVADMTQQQYESMKLRLFDEVKQSYFDYYYLGKSIEITTDNVELLREFERIARSKYESGSALYADLLKAQVELDKLSDRLETLKEQVPPTVARFNAALSRAPHAQIAAPKGLEDQAYSPNVEWLLGKLAKANPDLKKAHFLIEKEQARLQLARKEYYPDVTFGLDVVETERSATSNVVGNGKDAVVLGFSANIPIWRKKLKAGVSESKMRRRAALQSRIDLESQLSAKLELSVFKFRDAERKIELYRDSLIGKAEQNLTVTRSAFEAGKVDFLSLIDAERALLEFELNYEQAITDREKAISRIERIVGISLQKQSE